MVDDFRSRAWRGSLLVVVALFVLGASEAPSASAAPPAAGAVVRQASDAKLHLEITGGDEAITAGQRVPLHFRVTNLSRDACRLSTLAEGALVISSVVVDGAR